MGTMIQGYPLTEADFRGDHFPAHPVPLLGNNDLLSLTRPDVIDEIHRAYLEAGADIVETNTFSATRLPMSDYGVEDAVAEINLGGGADRAPGRRRVHGTHPGPAPLRSGDPGGR